MDIVRFLGRVLPPGFNVSVFYEPQIDFHDPVRGGPATFIVRVKDSAVDVECRVEKFDASNYIYLHNVAFDLARVAVDLLAFSTGFALSTTFEYFVHPDGTQEALAPRMPELAALCTAFRSGDDSFNEVFRLVAIDIELFMALRDLIESISTPHIGPINCGRVLDAIRRMIAPGAEPRKAWPAMQVALNISAPYQKWITDLSADPRHADRSYITGVDAVMATKRTWAIMNRFLEYRKRGSKPLTDPEFPALTA